MSRFLKIGEAAKYLGVSIQTLRRWETSGYLLPDKKTAGKKGQTRYYALNQLSGLNSNNSDLTLAYARVFSKDQKSDLERQIIRLEDYCIAKGWNYEIVSDLGSGMN